MNAILGTSFLEILDRFTWYAFMTKVGWAWLVFLALFLSERAYRQRLPSRPRFWAPAEVGFELAYFAFYLAFMFLMSSPDYRLLDREPFLFTLIVRRGLHLAPPAYPGKWLTIWDWALPYAPAWFLLAWVRGRWPREGGTSNAH